MSATFVVSVGNTEKEFTLYENLATRSSDFFRAAMSRDWKESRERKVVLADAKVDVFEGYLQWLNTGDITFHRNGSYSELADLYILGDYLGVSKFRGAVLDCLVERACSTETMAPNAILIARVWDQTRSGSPLRKLILEIWASLPLELVVKQFKQADKGYPQEFVLDYLQNLVDAHGLSKSAIPSVGRKEQLDNFRRGLYEE
jgi:hypothetical protein